MHVLNGCQLLVPAYILIVRELVYKLGLIMPSHDWDMLTALQYIDVLTCNGGQKLARIRLQMDVNRSFILVLTDHSIVVLIYRASERRLYRHHIW